MRKTKKQLATLGLAVMLAASMSMTAFAGEWKMEFEGLRYQNNGEYVIGWQWIGGRYYYFDTSGYLVVNKEIDGRTLNENGQWEVDGIIQKNNGEEVTNLNDSNAPLITEFVYGKNGWTDAYAKWYSSLNNSDITKVVEGGYTKGISNIALDIKKHTKEENAIKYQEESVLNLRQVNSSQISSWVKYKDLPYIVNYGVVHTTGYYSLWCDDVYDISDSRTAILCDITNPFDYMVCEADLYQKGYVTISGGVVFENDPDVGYQLISFLRSNTNDRYDVILR